MHSFWKIFFGIFSVVLYCVFVLSLIISFIFSTDFCLGINIELNFDPIKLFSSVIGRLPYQIGILRLNIIGETTLKMLKPCPVGVESLMMVSFLKLTSLTKLTLYGKVDSIFGFINSL